MIKPAFLSVLMLGALPLGKPFSKVTDTRSFSSNGYDGDYTSYEVNTDILKDIPYFQQPAGDSSDDEPPTDDDSDDEPFYGDEIIGSIAVGCDVLFSFQDVMNTRLLNNLVVGIDEFIVLDFETISELSPREQFDKIHKFLGFLGPGRVRGLEFGLNDEFVLDDRYFLNGDGSVNLEGNPTLESKTKFPPETEMVLIGIAIAFSASRNKELCCLTFHISPPWHGKKIVHVSLDYLNKSGNPVIEFQWPGLYKKDLFYRPRYALIKERGQQVLYY